MMVHVPGTTYKDLSRCVKNGWHFEKENEAEKEIMRNSFPFLEDMTLFLTSWRGMFKTSRKQIKLHPQKDYLDISNKLCSGTCGFRNCNMEVFFAPFFGCDLHLPPVYNSQEQCETGVSLGISPSVFTEDKLKDGYDRKHGSGNNDTHWSRCGKRTVYYSESTVNGVLLCIDEAEAKSESSRQGYLTESSYSEMVLNEKWKPDLSNLTWNKRSQWGYIPAYVDA